MTNFEIGRRIVEHEQKGAKRAGYGDLVVRSLAARLTDEFGRGFSKRNLDYMRRFFLDYSDRLPRIVQKPSAQLATGAVFQSPTDKLASSAIAQTPAGQFKNPFTLSWSHYVELLAVKDPDERSFYEIEATNESWSLSELKRQKATSLYQRLALSRDKAGINRLAKEGQLITKPEDLFKEPLVLEFLGLDERARYSETDLESAIIRLIQRAGRVDRIGQKSEEILCYSFIPAHGVERVIKLRERVRQRLH